MKSTHHDLSQVSCQHLKGVGKQTAEHLKRLDITCVQDILFHLPLRYQDRTRIVDITNVLPGDHVVIEGEVVSVSNPKGGRTRLLSCIQDDTGKMHLRFFYMSSAQQKTLQPGMRIRCFGEVRRGVLGLEMIHPEYRLATENLTIPVEETLTPIYPSTDGLSQSMWRKLTTQVLAMLINGGLLQDILPEAILKKLNFPILKDALQFVHRPPPHAAIDLLLEGKHISQKRLVFEELLAHRLSLLNVKQLFQTQRAVPLPKKNRLTDLFLKSLPFPLTLAQQKVITDIYQDIAKPHPMLRLIQGDVGSGKTLVAILAILQAVENGQQAAVLAPTELLVEQHYQTFKNWLSSLNIHVVMLTGQMKIKDKREALEQIAAGTANIILGTHAIFQKDVQFAKLVLIVIDEQHRFGVQQRALLREKGIQGDDCPHQLMMTATPIPRTLAMSVYADLDCSVIDELPPGRTPVKTSVVPNIRRADVLLRIRDACSAGRQAYWVCTLIEESDVLQCQAAEDTLIFLQDALPELTIALIHGRMKSIDKESAMAAFKKGEIHLLVATTVIEVGVDVPNASLMVIENSERLGLAQLHQLRGRVGRGTIESHCLLLYQAPLSFLAKERLKIMRETTDGFKIAARDLELRGPGEVLGTKQTGDMSLRIADLLRDDELLPMVQDAADQLQQMHPQLVSPLIKRWLRNSERFGQV